MGSFFQDIWHFRLIFCRIAQMQRRGANDPSGLGCRAQVLPGRTARSLMPGGNLAITRPPLAHLL